MDLSFEQSWLSTLGLYNYLKVSVWFVRQKHAGGVSATSVAQNYMDILIVIFFKAYIYSKLFKP